MPVKVTVTGVLDQQGGIRQYGDMYVFEVEATASKSAPKGLPVPTDETVSVVCNAKQLRAVRELIEGGDKVVAQGEVCGDVPAKQAFGTMAVVAFSLSTASLEASKRGEQAVGGKDLQKAPVEVAAAAGEPPAEVEKAAGVVPPVKGAITGPRRVLLADIVVPPELEGARLNPVKTAAARKEIAAGIMPQPLLVADIDGVLVLQDGYRRLLLLREFGYAEYDVELTQIVKFGLGTKVMPASGPSNHVDVAVQKAPLLSAGRVPASTVPPAKQNRGYVSCERCRQSMHPAIARRRGAALLCPDCAAGRVNPVTDKRKAILERGYEPTAQVVQDFVEITGVPVEDAPLQVRLLVVLGCMLSYDAVQRRFGYKGLMATVRDGAIQRIALHRNIPQPFDKLGAWVAKAMTIAEGEAQQQSAGLTSK